MDEQLDDPANLDAAVAEGETVADHLDTVRAAGGGEEDLSVAGDPDKATGPVASEGSAKSSAKHAVEDDDDDDDELEDGEVDDEVVNDDVNLVAAKAALVQKGSFSVSSLLDLKF